MENSTLKDISKNILKASMLGSIVIAYVALNLVACGPSGNKPNVELIQDMMESPALKAQEYDESAPNNSSARVPPDHTVPVGFTPYIWGMDLATALKENKNPMADKMDPETLIVGQKMFETHCMVCHGQKGQGGENQSVGQKMALKPPSLMSDKVRGLPDAHLYHIITMGQGVMGPYASHVPQKYRWQLVNYIRFLQKEAGK